MAFDHTIIAIDWRASIYSVIASEIFNTTAEIDWTGLKKAHPLADVTGPTMYQDKAAVLSPAQMRQYAVGPKALAFLDSLAKDAFLFLIHVGEWESGLPDD
jgi:hypothetical protein